MRQIIENWVLFDGHILVVRHWQLKSGVLGSILGNCFPLFLPHNIYMFVMVISNVVKFWLPGYMQGRRMMSVAKLAIILARKAHFGPRYFQQSGGALIALQLQTGSYHYFALLVEHVLTYVPCWILLQQFSLWTRPHKSRTHDYVSTSAENGLAMAGQANQFQCLCGLLFQQCLSWCSYCVLPHSSQEEEEGRWGYPLKTHHLHMQWPVSQCTQLQSSVFADHG